jgi:hypothetical protein
MNIHRCVTHLLNAIPEAVKQRLCGVMFTAVGCMSVIVSNDSGAYDITAAVIMVPLGLLMVFGKTE